MVQDDPLGIVLGIVFMPKPLLLARPSGLYVRFLIPADLRDRVGSRFIVRALRLPPGDGARLAAARLAMALSLAFRGLRAGAMVDVDQLIADAEAGRLPQQDFVVNKVRFADGTVLQGVVLDTPKDRADLKSMAEEHGGFADEGEDAEEWPGWPLSLAIAPHLDDLRRAKRAEKTILESTHTLRLLQGVVGDKPVNQITTDDCRAFLDAANAWPKNASRRPEFEGLTILEIVEAGKREQALREAQGEEPFTPAAATIRKHRQRLSVFFNSLRKAGRMKLNPLHGIPAPAVDEDDEGGRAYTQDELDRIFDPAGFRAWVGDLPHRFWGVLLALFSGARRNEIGQLYLADISAENGVWGFHINKRFPGQKIKGPPSRRFVPLAQPLLDAGFLQYVEDVKATKHERLFPHMPNVDGSGFGKQLGRQYIAYLNGLGQKEAGMGIHYFRNTLSTRLNRAGVPDDVVEAITGHKNARTILRKHYIDPPTLPDRVEALGKFDPGIAVPLYVPGEFDKALKEAHGLPEKWEKARRKRVRKNAKKAAQKAKR